MFLWPSGWDQRKMCKIRKQIKSKNAKSKFHCIWEQQNRPSYWNKHFNSKPIHHYMYACMEHHMLTSNVSCTTGWFTALFILRWKTLVYIPRGISELFYIVFALVLKNKCFSYQRSTLQYHQRHYFVAI